MTAFAFIRALGFEPKPIPVLRESRLSDRTGEAVTHHLIDTGLWNYSMGMELERNGERLSLRIFMPECGQNYRDLGKIEAGQVREACVVGLALNGHRVKFSDAIWCERGRKGWEVIVKAVGEAR